MSSCCRLEDGGFNDRFDSRLNARMLLVHAKQTPLHPRSPYIYRVRPPSSVRRTGSGRRKARDSQSRSDEWVRSQKGVTQKGALVRISELAEAKQRG
jgi:hypothetical protein